MENQTNDKTEHQCDTLKRLLHDPVRVLLDKQPNDSVSSSLTKPKANFEFNLHKTKTNKDKENNNNYLSEASTQTSFVESSSSSSVASSLTGSVSSGEVMKRSQQHTDHHKKEKLQQIISLQRQQHEKRIKALEKLAQLERLHAEKLRQIMLNTSAAGVTNNESLSSLLYDSFFRPKELENPPPPHQRQDQDSTTFDLDQLEREIKEQEYRLIGKRQSCASHHDFRPRLDVKERRRNSEFYAASAEQHGRRRYDNLRNFSHDMPPFRGTSPVAGSTGGVEILNLRNTTVTESRQPEGRLPEFRNFSLSSQSASLFFEGVYVVKENRDAHSKLSSKDENKRAFFTLVDYKKSTSSSHSRPYSSVSSNLAQYRYEQPADRRSPFNPLKKFTNPIYPLKDASSRQQEHCASSSSLSSASSSSFKSVSNLKLAHHHHLKSAMSEPSFKTSLHLNKHHSSHETGSGN